jgi:hypothetical protein
MAARHGAAVDQPVAVLLAKGGNVDDSKRIGRLDKDARPGFKCGKRLAGAQERQGAIEPPEIAMDGIGAQA